VLARIENASEVLVLLGQFLNVFDKALHGDILTGDGQLERAPIKVAHIRMR
jgi:hypothetical protein